MTGWVSVEARFTAWRISAASTFRFSGKIRTITSVRPDDSLPRKTRAERSGSYSASRPNFPMCSGALHREQPGGGSGAGSLDAPQEGQSQGSENMVDVILLRCASAASGARRLAGRGRFGGAGRLLGLARGLHV